MTLLAEADALIEGRLQLDKVFRGCYETVPNVQIIDQHALLQSRIDVVEALAGPGSVEYRVGTADDLADTTIKLDTYVFSHIANNLLSNARKYTTAGTVVLSFLGFQNTSSDDDPLLVFSVTDTGRGIPEEIRIRLFKEEATSADVRGVGLGASNFRWTSFFFRQCRPSKSCSCRDKKFFFSNFILSRQFFLNFTELH